MGDISRDLLDQKQRLIKCRVIIRVEIKENVGYLHEDFPNNYIIVVFKNSTENTCYSVFPGINVPTMEIHHIIW